MTERARIMVADDQPIVAEALANSLGRWFEVVGFVTSLARLDAELKIKAPDVLVLDLAFGTVSSLSILSDLVRRYPKTAIVILTAHVETALAQAAFRAGALGYVVKQSAATELRVAIEEALAGRVYLTPTMQVLGATAIDPTVQGEIVLTDRQRLILGKLHTGDSYAQIALQLGISTKTVEYHVDTVGRRLGIVGRVQITRWAERYLGDSNPQADEE